LTAQAATRSADKIENAAIAPIDAPRTAGEC
jgi:hypothetical protein